MSDLDVKIKQCIQSLSDKDLIKMLTAPSDEYHLEALTFAKSEAQRRRLTDISAEAVARLEAEEQRQVKISNAADKQTYNIYRTPLAFWRSKALGLIGCLFSFFAYLPISDLTSSVVIKSEEQVRIGVVLLCMGAGLYLILSDGLSSEQYSRDKLEGIHKWINLGAWILAVPMVVLGGWLLIRNGVT